MTVRGAGDQVDGEEVGQGAEIVLGLCHLFADEPGQVAEAGAAGRLVLLLRQSASAWQKSSW